MECHAPSHYSPQKALFTTQIRQLTLDIIDFYQQNRFFFIPNDLIEAFASLLGYYLVDTYVLNSPELEQALTHLKSNLTANVQKGFHLAELFKKYQQTPLIESEYQKIDPTDDWPMAALILDTNLHLSTLLTTNKQSLIQQPTPDVEARFTLFIRQQLYPALLQAIKHYESNPSQGDMAQLIMQELSIYTGGIAGFYANLLDTDADLFAAYTYICLESATKIKGQLEA